MKIKEQNISVQSKKQNDKISSSTLRPNRPFILTGILLKLRIHFFKFSFS